MAQNYAPSAWNLKAPIAQAIVGANGFPTDIEQRYRTDLGQILQQISDIRANISGTDGTGAVQAAINQGIQQGGARIVLPPRQFTMGTVTIPAGSPPIWIIGNGMATIVTRTGNLDPGKGLFDVYSSNFAMSDFVVDGGTNVPVGLLYGSGFSTSLTPSDPMAPSLTTNTSVWVHGGDGRSGFRFERMKFQHAGGYSILLDATSGEISNVDILSSWFANNRPTLFGTSTAAPIYGSWNGGVFAKGDGRSASGSQSGVVTNFLVQGCRFERNTGNCLWSHNWGFQRFHSNFRWIGNQFLDCGLDGMLVDVVSGGVVEGNVLRRVGYTTINDVDRSIPRWLNQLAANATGLDSGVVKGVNFIGNSLTSVNGGMIDLDTHCLGDVTGNICRVPYADECDYAEDQIAITGPTASGNGSYGINLGCNYNLAEGGSYIGIVGNTLLNLPNGAMRLFSARYCNVGENTMDVPAGGGYPPIVLGPQGLLARQRCYGNRIHHNQIFYPEASPIAAIQEDERFAAFTGGEINYCYGNAPIHGGTAIEFAKSPTSGSVVYGTDVWFP